MLCLSIYILMSRLGPDSARRPTRIEEGAAAPTKSKAKRSSTSTIATRTACIGPEAPTTTLSSRQTRHPQGTPDKHTDKQTDSQTDL
jgi:hypothetical protein